MASKKTSQRPKVTFKGSKPIDGVVHAKVNNGVMGPKIGFPHRHAAKIDTGLDVQVDEGYRLSFRIVPALADRGMVASNAPGRFMTGRVVINLINCGREIVEVKDGDPIAFLWIEHDLDADWVQE
jgi:dUTPase